MAMAYMNPEDEHMPTTQSALLTVGELNVAFRTRCRKAEARCAAEEPALVERDGGHASACHFAAPQETF
tara:strand:+ start:2807 stop:3013 length:207 start_codon:yes stop_codon:yes gene_type:complete